MWREFPGRLAHATGCNAVVYSRYGYGQSDPLRGDRDVRYMHDEALVALPQILDALCIERPILVGHSDGGSIALIHAGAGKRALTGVVTLAAHVLVEDISVASIAAAKTAYETTDLRAKLARYHADVDSAFWGWNRIWLHPDFRAWNIEEFLPRITCPVLGDPGRGRRIRHDGADAADRRAGARCRAARARGLPPLAAPGPARRRARGDHPIRRPDLRLMIDRSAPRRRRVASNCGDRLNCCRFPRSTQTPLLKSVAAATIAKCDEFHEQATRYSVPAGIDEGPSRRGCCWSTLIYLRRRVRAGLAQLPGAVVGGAGRRRIGMGNQFHAPGRPGLRHLVHVRHEREGVVAVDARERARTREMPMRARSMSTTARRSTISSGRACRPRSAAER